MGHSWEKPLFDEGVITGANGAQEWMLKPWYESYIKHNEAPILFIDFGMSTSAKEWCKKRGSLIDLPAQKIPLEKRLQSRIPDTIQQKREVWFQKPKALLSSIFKKSLWVDIDCLFFHPIAPIFDLIQGEQALAMRAELDVRAQSENTLYIVPPMATSYNTGVVAYSHGIRALQVWNNALEHDQQSHLGDQDALSTFIHKHSINITPMPHHMHHIHPELQTPDTIIHHFASDQGKNTLLEKSAFSSLAN